MNMLNLRLEYVHVSNCHTLLTYLQISSLWKYYFHSVSADKRICADRVE